MTEDQVFIGGWRIPAIRPTSGRTVGTHATWPWVRLTITDTEVSLEARGLLAFTLWPSWRRVKLRKAEMLNVHRGRLGVLVSFIPAVNFVTTGGQIFQFGTWRPRIVLEALSKRDYPVNRMAWPLPS